MTAANAGALALLVGLPLLVHYLWLCFTAFGGAIVVPASAADLAHLVARLPVPTAEAVVVYAAWIASQLVLHLAVPARWHEGQPLADGSRLRYRLNGWRTFWITLALAGAAVATGALPATAAYDLFGPLLATANVTAFALATSLYLAGRRPRRDGVAAYYLGVVLNPRIGSFDLKLFCESRPGLALWVVFNLSFAAAQYERHGVVTGPMLLVNAFQLLYVADFFFHEEAILTTRDITGEPFGWMLAWGNLVWVPFTYSLQAYYLVDHVHELSPLATAGIVALDLAGFAIFRGANLQKHRFRRDPGTRVWGRAPRYIRTARGALLLTSGWWGLARHLNYLGDLVMAAAWCLPTGFRHPLTYFYAAFMLVLLLHRERRDHAACRDKYGADWDEYCRQVPWRIVPGVY